MTEQTIAVASTLTGWRKSSYSDGGGGSCVEVIDGWRKSSYSGGGGGSCVEVKDGDPTTIPVRDSKDPHGPALLFPTESWTAFVSAIKRGDFPTA